MGKFCSTEPVLSDKLPLPSAMPFVDDIPGNPGPNYNHRGLERDQQLFPTI